MATIRAYTTIEQSRKLAEILPLESADMYYALSEDESTNMIDFGKPQGFFDKTQVAWSLAALLGVLPEYNLQRTDWGNKTEYKIVVTTDEDNYASKNYDNPLDACVAMIEKLHELKML